MMSVRLTGVFFICMLLPIPPIQASLKDVDFEAAKKCPCRPPRHHKHHPPGHHHHPPPHSGGGGGRPPVRPPIVLPPIVQPPIIVPTPPCPPSSGRGGSGGPGGKGKGGKGGGGGGGSEEPKTCPIDALKLGLCVDVLSGLVHVGIGNPVVNVCCPVIQGMLELEAAICLCTVLRIKLLNLNIFLPLALQIFAQCGLTPPPGFVCPPLV